MHAASRRPAVSRSSSCLPKKNRLSIVASPSQWLATDGYSPDAPGAAAGDVPAGTGPFGVVTAGSTVALSAAIRAANTVFIRLTSRMRNPEISSFSVGSSSSPPWGIVWLWGSWTETKNQPDESKTLTGIIEKLNVTGPRANGWRRPLT